MDQLKEEKFVQQFIRKNRRERLLYELASKKKRYEGISRFCHQAEDFLDDKLIVMQGEDLERQNDFQKFIKKHDQQCYILSPDYDLNEATLPLETAVIRAAMNTDAVVIIGDNFAIVYTEAMKTRGKYLLVNEKK